MPCASATARSACWSSQATLRPRRRGQRPGGRRNRAPAGQDCPWQALSLCSQALSRATSSITRSGRARGPVAACTRRCRSASSATWRPGVLAVRKKTLSVPRTGHRPQGRKQRAERLADAGGRLHHQRVRLHAGPVHRAGQFALPGAKRLSAETPDLPAPGPCAAGAPAPAAPSPGIVRTGSRRTAAGHRPAACSSIGCSLWSATSR